MYRDKRIYFAYGMNTNKESMAQRCPDARFIGKKTIKGFKLVFRGVADIDYTGNSDDKVEGALWAITPKCEKALDSLEGFPTFYTKGYFKDRMYKYPYNSIMYYIMTKRSKQSDYSYPSEFYKDCLEEGYKYSSLNLGQLKQALKGLREPNNRLTYVQIKQMLNSQYEVFPPRGWNDE